MAWCNPEAARLAGTQAADATNEPPGPETGMREQSTMDRVGPAVEKAARDAAERKRSDLPGRPLPESKYRSGQTPPIVIQPFPARSPPAPQTGVQGSQFAAGDTVGSDSAAEINEICAATASEATPAAKDQFLAWCAAEIRASVDKRTPWTRDRHAVTAYAHRDWGQAISKARRTMDRLGPAVERAAREAAERRRSKGAQPTAEPRPAPSSDTKSGANTGPSSDTNAKPNANANARANANAKVTISLKTGPSNWSPPPWRALCYSHLSTRLRESAASCR